MKSNLEIFNLNDLCRLCLNQLGAVNIFKPIDMTKDILITAGVKILLSDALPKSICKKCYSVIKDCINLKNVSQRNDARLRALMGGDPDYSTDGFQVTTKYSSKAQGQDRQESTPAHVPCRISNTISNSPETQNGAKKQSNKNKSLNNKREPCQNNSPVPSDFSDVSNNVKKRYKTITLRTQNNIRDGYDDRTIKVRNDIYAVPAEINLKVADIKSEVKETHDNETESNQMVNNIKIEVAEITEVAVDKSFGNERADSDNRLPTPITKRRLLSNEDIEFTYGCDTCYKVFPTRKRLVLHLRNHIRPFRCLIEDCHKSFACNHDLQKHMRCHTGEKPYQCRFCLKSFAQNVSLKYHRTHAKSCTEYFKALGPDEMILSDLPSLDCRTMPALEALLEQPQPIEMIEVKPLPIEVQIRTGTEVLQGQVTSDLQGEVTSTLQGEVISDLPMQVTSDSQGHVTPLQGQVISDIQEEVTTDVQGKVTFNLQGEVISDIQGEVAFDLQGQVTTDVLGQVISDIQEVTFDLQEEATTDVQGKVTDSQGQVTSETVLQEQVTFDLQDQSAI